LGVTVLLLKQVAQLSQRDRAAGCVSYSRKWKTGTGRQLYGYYMSIFNHCDVFGQHINRNRRKKRKIKAITPFKFTQGHRDRYQSKASMRLPIND